MYDEIAVLINGEKYILSYNPELMKPSDLSNIIDLQYGIEEWNDILTTNYDSKLVEYEEQVIEFEEL